MTTNDLTNNRESIIREIRRQVTMATNENIKAVMTKMVAMLPQFENEKGTKANVMKLASKAIGSYLKYGHTWNSNQAAAVDAAIEVKRNQVIENL